MTLPRKQRYKPCNTMSRKNAKSRCIAGSELHLYNTAKFLAQQAQVTPKNFIDCNTMAAHHMPMKLSEWLEKTGWSQSDMAREIGVSRATISRLVNNKAQPSFGLVRKIERATKGKVAPGDWPAPPKDNAGGIAISP